MATFRAFLTSSLLLAIAANPVAAALLPCCCSGQEMAKCPVCRSTTKPAQTQGSKDCCHSCCHSSAEADETGANVIPLATVYLKPASCTCVKGLPPATMAPDKVSAPSAKRTGLAATTTALPVIAVPALRLVAPTGRIKTATGPPLLALYCTWLK